VNKIKRQEGKRKRKRKKNMAKTQEGDEKDDNRMTTDNRKPKRRVRK
jgi:hypothetical protein